MIWSPSDKAVMSTVATTSSLVLSNAPSTAVIASPEPGAPSVSMKYSAPLMGVLPTSSIVAVRVVEKFAGFGETAA